MKAKIALILLFFTYSFGFNLLVDAAKYIKKHKKPTSGYGVDYELLGIGRCDTTKTCRFDINNYDFDNGKIMLHFTIKAGAKERLKAQVAFENIRVSKAGYYQREYCMIIDDKTVACQKQSTLTSLQTKKVIDAILGKQKLEFMIGSKPYRSIEYLGDFKEVLQKIDEFQNRAGTIGALINKGNLPEDNVTKPIKAIKYAQTPYITSVDDYRYIDKHRKDIKSAIENFIKAKMQYSMCSFFSTSYQYFAAKRVSKDKFLVFSDCNKRYAYTGFWLIDDKYPFKNVEYLEDLETYQTEFSNGVLYTSSWTMLLLNNKFQPIIHTLEEPTMGVKNGVWKKTDDCSLFNSKVSWDKIDKKQVAKEYKKFIKDMIVFLKNKEDFKIVNINLRDIKDMIMLYPIDKANIEDYNNFAYYLAINTKHFELSDYILKKVIKINPNRAVTYLNIADKYWNIDNTVDNHRVAMKYYRQYKNILKAQGNIKNIPKRVLDRKYYYYL